MDLKYTSHFSKLGYVSSEGLTLFVVNKSVTLMVLFHIGRVCNSFKLQAGTQQLLLLLANRKGHSGGNGGYYNRTFPSCRWCSWVL